MEKMNKVICFYHSRDLDGWTSAAIVKMKFSEAILVGWDYGDEDPGVYDVNYEEDLRSDPTSPMNWNIENPTASSVGIPNQDATIILVDICFDIETMKNLLDYPIDIFWFDHHKSAIEKAEGVEGVALLNGVRRRDFAACELVWQFFFPKADMPEMVRLLGRYDCFGHKGTAEEERVLMFQYAARAMASNPEEATQFLQNRDTFYINQVVSDGEKIYKYLCVEARQAYENGFEVTFDGHPFIVIPKERINPVNFGIDYHKDGYSGAACFWYVDHKWKWSLYNDNGKLDVSVLCEKRGGGGHAGASGFVSIHLEMWDP